jgi:hypothetical protein
MTKTVNFFAIMGSDNHLTVLHAGQSVLTRCELAAVFGEIVLRAKKA